MDANNSRRTELPLAFHGMTMAAAIRAAAARAPGKLAIRLGTEQRSYAQLVQRIDRIAAATVGELGNGPGATAAVAAHNAIEYLEVLCGVPDAGVPVATVNARLAPPEIAAICDDAQAQLLFVDRQTAAQLRGVKFRSVRRIIEFGPEFEQWIANACAPGAMPVVEEWDTWSIPYTSGTTGEPKGVMLSHRARLLNFFAKAVEYGCFSPDDRFLSITPMNFGPGTSFPLNALVLGGSVEIMGKFDPEAVLHKLRHENFSGIFTVPTHFHEFFALGEATLQRYRRPPLKTIISNSAPLPQELKPAIVDYFGDGVLHELYASTETSLVCNLRPPDQLRKERCVGLPFPHTLVEIRDASGRVCAPREVGELFATSPYIFSGYWQRPQATAAAFHDGWVSVGDLAMRDEEGYIYIVDRKKDMVISGGVNIYPREVEDVLIQHPAIAEVAVVGVADAKWGERLKACVVLRAGQSLTLADVERFCDGRLAAFKRPKELAVLPSLPRNANGKVVKSELRSMP